MNELGFLQIIKAWRNPQERKSKNHVSLLTILKLGLRIEETSLSMWPKFISQHMSLYISDNYLNLEREGGRKKEE